MADQRPSLDIGALITWPAAMLNEVAALPDTLKSARQLIVDLGKLADHLAAVGDQIERQLDNLIGPMTKTVNQVDSIEASVTELRNTLFGILKPVPGARKSLVDLANPGRRAELDSGGSG
jgi:ABC-type transporter Mla subunit MlaD